MNTGVEAVETAIKLARRYGYERKGIPHDQAEIVVFNDNFHGRTTAAISASSTEDYRKDFGPFTPGFVRVPYGDYDALAAAINQNTCAILIEPIQGEGGVNVPPEGFLKRAWGLCSEHRVLFMADEIQTGLGRTAISSRAIMKTSSRTSSSSARPWGPDSIRFRPCSRAAIS